MNSSNLRAKRIEKLLKIKLLPSHISIKDNSYQHATHGNIEKGATETHLFIKIISQHFNGMKKVEMHQLVYKILKEEFNRGLHALELELDVE